MFKNIDPKQLQRYNKKMEEINEEYTPRKVELGAWQEWYAWRPVKVHGKRVWLKKVFRRCINTYVDHDDWKRYEYGTMFDVLKNEPVTHVGQNPPKAAPPMRGFGITE